MLDWWNCGTCWAASRRKMTWNLPNMASWMRLMERRSVSQRGGSSPWRCGPPKQSSGMSDGYGSGNVSWPLLSVAFGIGVSCIGSTSPKSWQHSGLCAWPNANSLTWGCTRRMRSNGPGVVAASDCTFFGAGHTEDCSSRSSCHPSGRWRPLI